MKWDYSGRMGRDGNWKRKKIDEASKKRKKRKDKRY